jgi:glycosyltransferase involved in cell wall biosynthesis
VLYADRRDAGSLDVPEGAEVRGIALSGRRDPLSAGRGRGAGDLVRLARAGSARRLDAFLFPSLLSYYPVVGVPTVVGLLDATAAELPALVLASRGARARWRLKQRVAVHRARGLFTLSDSSRAALAGRLRIPPERLAVVGAAPAPVFSPRGGETLARGLGEVGLSPGEPFLLYAGGINPHKNVETLLEAVARLRPEAPPLVLVGALEGSYVPAAGAVRLAHGLGDRVRTPGHVSDEVLACLYSAATAVVIPSLAEGFGLPAVEAAACGAPLVLSDIPAHRESMADGALYFAPTDAQALASQVERVLDDEPARSALAARGRELVSRLSWDATAQRLRALLAEVAEAG